MADEHHYIEMAGCAVITAIGAAWRWVSGRERKLKERLNSVEERIVTNDKRLAILEAQRQSDQAHMERIEDTLVNVDKKQDEQMKILVELSRGQGR